MYISSILAKGLMKNHLSISQGLGLRGGPRNGASSFRIDINAPAGYTGADSPPVFTSCFGKTVRQFAHVDLARAKYYYVFALKSARV
jgi:hypothetical protein